MGHSFLSLALIRPCSTDIPRSPRLLFTPSIHPIFGLPLVLPPLASDPVILFTIRPSSILSTCPNHLNPCCSALFDSSRSTPVRLRTSSFLSLSHLVTPHIFLRHLISSTFRAYEALSTIPG